ncbi:MAG: hypothetical protein V4472_08525 [Pseudomonadota bacterium]
MASTPPTRTPLAGGALIAFGAMAGAAIGLFRGEPTVGFLIGTGAGIALAIAIWLLNLRR